MKAISERTVVSNPICECRIMLKQYAGAKSCLWQAQRCLPPQREIHAGHVADGELLESLQQFKEADGGHTRAWESLCRWCAEVAARYPNHPAIAPLVQMRGCADDETFRRFQMGMGIFPRSTYTLEPKIIAALDVLEATPVTEMADTTRGHGHPGRRFAVACSFPGEKRAYVEAVDECLTKSLPTPLRCPGRSHPIKPQIKPRSFRRATALFSARTPQLAGNFGDFFRGINAARLAPRNELNWVDATVADLGPVDKTMRLFQLPCQTTLR